VRRFVGVAGTCLALVAMSVFCLAQEHSVLSASDNSTVANGAAASGTAANAAQPATNEGGAEAAVVEQSPAPAQSGRMFASKVGVGVKMSLLGIGVEAAIPVTYRTNVRAGFNTFSYSRGFTNDGTNYAASLTFRSFETHFDWFPFGGGFHLSPGAMLYNGNQIKATATVPGTQSFTLGGTTYTSDPSNPIGGTGKIGFNSAAPLFTLGWGNLVSRKENKHISIPVELGVMFQGSPKATLNLAGNVCDANGLNCHNVAGDTTFQSNVIAQQNKLNNDMSFFKVYPIISVGFGYKF